MKKFSNLCVKTVGDWQLCCLLHFCGQINELRHKKTWCSLEVSHVKFYRDKTVRVVCGVPNIVWATWIWRIQKVKSLPVEDDLTNTIQTFGLSYAVFTLAHLCLVPRYFAASVTIFFHSKYENKHSFKPRNIAELFILSVWCRVFLNDLLITPCCIP